MVCTWLAKAETFGYIVRGDGAVPHVTVGTSAVITSLWSERLTVRGPIVWLMVVLSALVVAIVLLVVTIVRVTVTIVLVWVLLVTIGRALVLDGFSDGVRDHVL